MQNEDRLPDAPHKFVPVSKVKQHLLTCDVCGHIPLKNAISTLVTRLGCAYAEKNAYKKWVDNGYRF